MSSFTRTLQKRIMRSQGYVRQTSRVVVIKGIPRVVPYRKGEGPIHDPDGEQCVGRDGQLIRCYPQFSKIATPANRQKKFSRHTARALGLA